MLVISRYPGQAIYIGDDIKVIVLQSGQRIKLGIKAPQHIKVCREEIYHENYLIPTDKEHQHDE